MDGKDLYREMEHLAKNKDKTKEICTITLDIMYECTFRVLAQLVARNELSKDVYYKVFEDLQKEKKIMCNEVKEV